MANEEAGKQIDQVFNNYGSKSDKNVIKLGNDIYVKRINNDQRQASEYIPSPIMRNLIKKYTDAIATPYQIRNKIQTQYE